MELGVQVKVPQIMTLEYNKLMQSTAFREPEQLHIGNGQGLPISHIGSPHILRPFKSSVLLSLNQILHIPQITKNPFSVSIFSHKVPQLVLAIL